MARRDRAEDELLLLEQLAGVREDREERDARPLAEVAARSVTPQRQMAQCSARGNLRGSQRCD